MAFPFDLLDLFIPEIAHWMAGKSTSEKRRFRNAGVGLFGIGLIIALGTFIFPTIFKWAFTETAWAYFIAFMFIGCGSGLLICIYTDKKYNSDISE
jgi:O-antigen/teichoic acid export membrane protein